MLSAYATEFTLIAGEMELSALQSFSTRCRQPTVKALVALFGQSLPLYNIVLAAIREKFVETGDLAYCGLRIDVLMASCDAGSAIVCQIPP